MSEYTTPQLVADFAESEGLPWPSDAAERLQAITRATRYLDRLPWRGVRSSGRFQDRAWPRDGVRDSEGHPIGPAEIPREVVEAANRLAVAEAQDPGFLSPTVSADQMLVQETIGPMSFTYRMPTGPADYRSTLLAVSELLRDLVKGQSYDLHRA